jgi:hypothetical protein
MQYQSGTVERLASLLTILLERQIPDLEHMSLNPLCELGALTESGKALGIMGLSTREQSCRDGSTTFVRRNGLVVEEDKRLGGSAGTVTP